MRMFWKTNKGHVWASESFTSNKIVMSDNTSNRIVLSGSTSNRIVMSGSTSNKITMSYDMISYEYPVQIF